MAQKSQQYNGTAPKDQIIKPYQTISRSNTKALHQRDRSEQPNRTI